MRRTPLTTTLRRQPGITNIEIKLEPISADNPARVLLERSRHWQAVYGGEAIRLSKFIRHHTKGNKTQDFG